MGRSVAIAQTDTRGRWTAYAPQRARATGSLRRHLHVDDIDEKTLVGFDFPIGIPRAYAERAGITDFVDFLAGCGHGEWSDFFEVADSPSEIRLQRPFYPRTYLPKGSKKRAHLTAALELDYASLLRRCERRRPGRREACSLFWTLGGNQVGRAAITGWRLLQAEPISDLRCWPFDGRLDELLEGTPTVVVETYPTESALQIGLGNIVGKRQRQVRQMHAQALLRFARSLDVNLDPALEHDIRDGFGAAAGGDDKFDAVIGLFGLLNVLEHRRSPGDPEDHAVRTVEGWIMGQEEL